MWSESKWAARLHLVFIWGIRVVGSFFFFFGLPFVLFYYYLRKWY